MAFTDASARAALRQVFDAAIASADPRQVLRGICRNAQAGG